MTVFILKHIKTEGAGTILDYLRNEEIPYQIIELWRGEPLPQNLKEVSAVIAMGGPMNVYEEDNYPFLKDENLFIQKLIKAKIPYLGICLGAQLLAKAANGKVYKGKHEEIGWYKVKITDQGKKDPLLMGLPDDLNVFQWHRDTFTIPPNGILLARGKPVLHQALKAGENAYGFQFHIEVNQKILEKWFPEKSKNKKYVGFLKKIRTSYNQIAKKIYKNFFALVH